MRRGTYGDYLRRDFDLPAPDGRVTEYFAFNKNEQLTVNVPGYPALRVTDIIKNYKGKGIQVFVPQILEEQFNRLRLMYQRLSREYTAPVYNAYATKANDGDDWVKGVSKMGGYLETSSFTGVEAMQRLYKQGFLGNQLVIHNGYITDKYFQEIINLRQAGFTWSIPVLDKPEILRKFYKTQEKFGVGIRQKARIGARTPRALDTVKDHFGMPFREVLLLARRIKEIPQLEFVLYHAHLGSQILDRQMFLDGLLALGENYCRLAQEFPSLYKFDIGGGAPWPGTLASLPWDLEGFLREFLIKFGKMCDDERVRRPMIITEYGRWLTAPTKFDVWPVMAVHGSDLLMMDSVMNSAPDMWAINEKFIILPVGGLSLKSFYARICGWTCDHDDHTPEMRLPIPPEGTTENNPFYFVLVGTGAYQGQLRMRHCMQLEEGIVAVKYFEGAWHYNYVKRPETPNQMLTGLGW
jgi:arginine decarboxylase